MVDLPEADGPERPRITGWRMAADEKEEKGKGLLEVDDGEEGNGEEE